MNVPAMVAVGVMCLAVEPAFAETTLRIMPPDGGVLAAGQRVDNFLSRILKGVPKSHIYRILRSGEVRINKGRVGPDARLALGDVVRVPPVRTAAPARPPVSGGGFARVVPELPILFEDDALIALDKPSGLAVHGGSGIALGLIEQLRAARPEAKFLELARQRPALSGWLQEGNRWGNQ